MHKEKFSREKQRAVSTLKDIRLKLGLLVHGANTELLRQPLQKTPMDRELLFKQLTHDPSIAPLIPFFLPEEGKEGYVRNNILELERKLLQAAGFKSVASFLQKVSKETVTVSFLAGASTRWLKSIDDPNNAETVTRYEIDKKHPRSLGNIDNLTPELFPDEQVAHGVYNLLAFKGLGEHVILYGGKTDDEAEENKRLIQRKIVDKLGINVVFVKQKIHPGQEKVLDHGDGLLQVFDNEQAKRFLKKKFLITQWASDANSFQSITLNLLLLYVFDKYGFDISSMIPTTFDKQTEGGYFFKVDERGIPIDAVHAKEKFEDSVKGGKITTQSNVGPMLFRLKPLRHITRRHYKRFNKLKAGLKDKDGNPLKYTINSDGGLKIDNFFRDMMKYKGFATLSLPVCLHQEIDHSIKGVDDYKVFMNDLKIVLAQDKEFIRRNKLDGLSQENFTAL